MRSLWSPISAALFSWLLASSIYAADTSPTLNVRESVLGGAVAQMTRGAGRAVDQTRKDTRQLSRARNLVSMHDRIAAQFESGQLTPLAARSSALKLRRSVLELAGASGGAANQLLRRLIAQIGELIVHTLGAEPAPGQPVPPWEVRLDLTGFVPTRLHATYGWVGLGRARHLNGDWTRRGDEFVGAGIPPVPVAAVAQILGSLRTVNRSDGTGSCFSHTDDYPSLDVSLTSAGGDSLRLVTASNCPGYLPWGVVYADEAYVQYDPATVNALAPVFESLGMGASEPVELEGEARSRVRTDVLGGTGSSVFDYYASQMKLDRRASRFIEHYFVSDMHLECTVSADNRRCHKVSGQVRLRSRNLATTHALHVTFDEDGLRHMAPTLSHVRKADNVAAQHGALRRLRNAVGVLDVHIKHLSGRYVPEAMRTFLGIKDRRGARFAMTRLNVIGAGGELDLLQAPGASTLVVQKAAFRDVDSGVMFERFGFEPLLSLLLIPEFDFVSTNAIRWFRIHDCNRYESAIGFSNPQQRKRFADEFRKRMPQAHVSERRSGSELHLSFTGPCVAFGADGALVLK